MVAVAFALVTAFTAPLTPMSAPRHASTPCQLTASLERDFSKDATALFFSLRLAALFPAGATFGAAFAMMPSASDAITLGLFKRLHLLIAVASVCNAMIAVTMSTVAINRLALSPSVPATSLKELLRRDFDFLWAGCNVHFLAAICGLATMLAIRSYAAFPCPHFGRTGAFGVLGGLALICSVVLTDDECSDEPGMQSGLTEFIGRYPNLLWRRMRQGNVWTIVSALLCVYSCANGAYGFYHVYEYMRR